MTQGEITLVGMGCQAGQVSLAGATALGLAGWTGFFGLPADLRAELETLVRNPVDLDRLLGEPWGFVQRLCDLMVQTARTVGSAALAVHGHPAIANPATPMLVARAAQEQISIRIIAGPSVLDDYLAFTGIDPVEQGIFLIDARAALKLPMVPSSGLAIWNCGYLSPTQFEILHTRLIHIFGAGRPLRLFRTGPHRSIDIVPLDLQGLWQMQVTSETTIFLH